MTFQFTPPPRLIPGKPGSPAGPGGGVPLLRVVSGGGAVSQNENNNPLLRAAIGYIERGWWVLPLHPRTKDPVGRLVPHGCNSATNSADVVRQWWNSVPDANIGIAIKKSGLVVIDVDPRNGGVETFERLQEKHGKISSAVEQLSGGGGNHLVYLADDGLSLPGKLGPGVDLLSGARYFLAEPSVHPDTGKQYLWEASSDPLQGCVPSVLPLWVKDLARLSGDVLEALPGARYVDQKQIAELRDALQCVSAEDYHQWVNFGQALTELGHAGYALWDEWSQTSTKYDSQVMLRKWRSFKPGAYQVESIFFTAQQCGWVNPASIVSLEPAPVPVEMVTVAADVVPVNNTFEQAPDKLLSPPGVLGQITEWVNKTSRKHQPMFAVQTAIAIGCAILGRRYVTTTGNWPTLYMVNVGKSASGKEHAKHAIESALDQCGLSGLIGPNGYTSDSGVLSALHSKPSHVTVMDEFGKELEMASIKGNARARGTLKTLMEMWGRCGGVARPQGYSTVGLNQTDAARIEQRMVHNPALTLVAMSTPETFFENVGGAAVSDGFLNRLLIVESDHGRQVSKIGDGGFDVPLPDAVIQWANAMVDGTELSQAAPVPTPTLVEMSRAALELFRNFDQECVEQADQWEVRGLHDMWGRTNEIAMRLALVVAMGTQMQAPFVVDGQSAAWAIQYVRYHCTRTVVRLESSLSDTDFEATKNQVLGLLVKAGKRGLTVREISKASRKFRALPQRQQIEVLMSLSFVGDIARVTVPTLSGQAREAWVAVADGELAPPVKVPTIADKPVGGLYH